MTWDKRLYSYTEDVLIDQTTSGLVRRARKSIEKTPIHLVKENESNGILKVGEFTVKLEDAPLTQSSCDCPATGICIHILMGVIWNNNKLSEAADDHQNSDILLIEQELEKLITEQVFQWAGKIATKKTLALLTQLDTNNLKVNASISSIEIYINEDIKCRYVMGVGLDGVICDASENRRKSTIQLCLLVWYQYQGHEIKWPKYLQEEDCSEELTRIELELIEQIKDKLDAILQNGIMHLSSYYPESLKELAWSSRGERLPKITGSLLKLSNQITQLQAGSSQSDSQEILTSIMSCWTLCEALKRSNTKADLKFHRGSLRRQYIPREIGPLFLSSIKQYDSNSSKGIHLLFWDLVSGIPYTLNIGRMGEVSRSYNLSEALITSIGWNRSSSPEQLIGRVIKLDNSKVSENNRLSKSNETTLVKNFSLNDYTNDLMKIMIRSWDKLINELKSISVIDTDNVPDYLIISPKKISKFEIDLFEQQWTSWVKDTDNQWIQLKLKSDHLNDARVQKLNKIIESSPENIRGVTLEVFSSHNLLTLSPRSFIIDEKTGLSIFDPDLHSYHLIKKNKLSSFISKFEKNIETSSFSGDDKYKNIELVFNEINEFILGVSELGINCLYSDNLKQKAILKKLIDLNSSELIEHIESFQKYKDSNSLIKLSYYLSVLLKNYQIEKLNRI